MKIFSDLQAKLFTIFCLAVALAGAASWSRAQGPAATPVPAAPAVAQNQSTGDLLHKGYQSIKDKDYPQAEQQLDQARKQSPKDAYVLLNLAVVYQLTGRSAASENMYKKIIDDNDTSAPAGQTTAPDDSQNRGVGTSPIEIAKRNLALIQTSK